MLPPPTSELRSIPQVTVTFYSDVSPTLAEQPPVGEQHATSPSLYWQTAGMCLLVAVGGLVFLRWKYYSMRPNPHASAQLASNSDAEAVTVNSPSSPIDGVWKEESHMREEIRSKIRQDPEAAARVLQEWLDKAA